MAQKTVVLLSGSSWEDPGDTNGGLLDSVETIADGGGGCGANNSNQGTGGGGGQWAIGTDFAVTFPVPFGIGLGGAGGASGDDLSNNGAAGTGTWFGGSSLATCLVGSGPGGGGKKGGPAGAGGTGTYGSKTTARNNGGAGGANNNEDSSGTGGGGAGGPSGAGAAGGAVSSGSNGGGSGGGAPDGGTAGTANTGSGPGTVGGTPSGGTGGTGGTSGSPNGGAGTDGGAGGGAYGGASPAPTTGGTGGDGSNESIYTDSTSGLSYGPGAGGGGGAGGKTADGSGGAGGYGAGGGSAGSDSGKTGVGGPGGQGFIVIKYTPASSGATGTGAAAEAADTVSGSGSTSNIGAGAASEGADVASGSGALSAAGSAAVNEAHDVVSGAGNAGDGAFGAVVEGADVASGTGGLAVSGSGAVTEGHDTVAGAGAVKATGAAAISEAADVVAAAGGAGTPPGAPQNVQVINQGGAGNIWGDSSGSVTGVQVIQWSAAAPGAYAIDHYKVYRNGAFYATVDAATAFEGYISGAAAAVGNSPAGSVLTVTSLISGQVFPGVQYQASGLAAGTMVNGQYGYDSYTGTGGAGTYAVIPEQTFASSDAPASFSAWQFIDNAATACIDPTYSSAATIYSYTVSAVDTEGNEGPQSSQLSMYLYQNGWAYCSGDNLDYSGAVSNYHSTSGNPQGGTYCLQANCTANDSGINPASDAPLSPEWTCEIGAFGYLTLDVNPGTNADITISLSHITRLPPGDVYGYSNSVDNIFAYGPAPIANTWGTYEIPLEDLGIGVCTFTGSITGTTLTVTEIFSGPSIVDADGFIFGAGVPAETYITAYGQSEPTGTFTVAGPGISGSTSVSARTMTFQRSSFYKMTLQPSAGATFYLNNIAWKTQSSAGQGSGSSVESADVVAAAGATSTTGAGATTEAHDVTTGTGSGAGSATGIGSAVEGADVAAAAGAASAKGAAAPVESHDVVAGIGAASTSGAAAITEGVDTASAQGAPGDAGAASIIEGHDVAAGAGALSTVGAAAIAEGHDAIAGAAAAGVAGAGSIAEAADSAQGAAGIGALGAASIDEPHDIATAAGRGAAGAIGEATEEPDEVEAAGAIEAAGNGTAVERADIVSGEGEVGAEGAGDPVESPDVVVGAGAASPVGSGAAVEAPDVSSGSGSGGSQSLFPFPVQAVTARQQLRQAVLAALEGAELTIGTTAVSVDSPGDWPYRKAKLPAVCVRSATDNKTSLNRSSTNFTTSVELDVRAAVCATTSEAAQAALETLWFEVEQTILQDFYVLQLIENVSSIESNFEFKAKGQVHFGGAIGRFRFETFESFDVALQYGAPAARSIASPIEPLTEVTVDVTRSNSDPPYSAQAGDVGLTITLPED